MTQNKLIVVSRRDLTASYQSVQAGHAIAKFHYEYPGISKKWYIESNYLVYLSVKNESELHRLIFKLKKSNLNFSVFTEPDIDNQITSVCIEPSDKTKRITSSLPLMLSDYYSEDKIDKNNFIKGETL